MNLFVIDIGGSTIKYATWDGEQLDAKKSLPTPNSWKAMKEQFIAEIKSSTLEFQEWQLVPLVQLIHKRESFMY